MDKSRKEPESYLCLFSNRFCQRNKLDGYEYCVRHILEDKSAPYKQCNYVYPKNGKRCPNAALKGEKKDGYCQDHQKKAAQMRSKLSRKYRPIETPETLLEELEYSVSEENKTNPESRTRDNSTHDISSFGFPALSGFNQELFSDPESEREIPLCEQAWADDGDSDAESVNSEQEDILKHAGTYTAEEVALITRDKLIRLQSLYIEQFKRLQYVLKEKRRKYVAGLKQEKETMGSIHATPRNSFEAVRHYQRLKAATRYHRRHGQELILHNREQERRLSFTEGNATKSPPIKCLHTIKSDRCPNKPMPMSKYCIQHILFDPHQILFKVCNSANTCKRAVIPAVDGVGCCFHASLPPHLLVEVKPVKEDMDDQTTVNTEAMEVQENNAPSNANENSENENSIAPLENQQELCQGTIFEEVEVPSLTQRTHN